jgi:hypothetical protein
LGGGSGARRVLRAITESQGPPNPDPSQCGNRREHQPPGRTPRELARSGRGALTPNRRPGARRASAKEQGKYWHDTAAPPSRGMARGVLRTQRTTRPSCMCALLVTSDMALLANLRLANLRTGSGEGPNAQRPTTNEFNEHPRKLGSRGSRGPEISAIGAAGVGLNFAI